MKNLLMKLQNKKNEKKGFTLVELLVVIAILAILASVSVVGYLGFTEKAKNSNALTELTQVKTVIMADLLDGEDKDYAYSNDTLYFIDRAEAPKDGEQTSFKTDFTDLKDLDGTLTFTFGTAENLNGATGAAANDYPVTKIVYTLANGGVATWTMGANGGIKAGK